MAAGLKCDVRMTLGELLRRLDAKKLRVLKKQGGYLKSAMQRSMRYTSDETKRSNPGKPPLAHKKGKNGKGPLLRKFIAYNVDARNGSVVTGPKMLKRKRTIAKPLPEAMDKGATVKPDLGRLSGPTLGKPGPIRNVGAGYHQYDVLETEAMVERSQRIIAEENDLREMYETNAVARHIAPRPFTAPLLTDGGENFRKLAAREPL